MADNEARDLLSVGVDVGTTTTQIVFSRLSLTDVSRPGQIPRINITDRAVIYQSPIIFTPLKDYETIDADKLSEIVHGEYAAAGVPLLLPRRAPKPAHKKIARVVFYVSLVVLLAWSLALMLHR